MKSTNFSHFFIILNAVFCNPISNTFVQQAHKGNRAVKLLQEYVQINTSREENIERAVEFWKFLAAEVGLSIAVYKPTTKPICVITWTGADPTLPSIILNSHMDVVPVEEGDWTYEPFSGYIDDEGNMFGRGTQDTKAVGIQYLEAIRRMKQNNVTLQRTLHLTLMPDEETGGKNGIIPFVETKEFEALNCGFVLDEGISSTDGTLFATYVDKRAWQIKFRIHGAGGHGSSTISGSAMEKMQKLINICMRFREQQLQIMDATNATDYGAYTTLNINIVNGGIAPNVIPTKVTVLIDMRLSVSTTVNDMDSMLQSWLTEIGNETEIEFIRRIEKSMATRVDHSNPYWVAFEEALKGLNIPVMPVVLPATSDMVVLRNKGIPAIGFAYRPYTVSRLHDVDEYLNMETFLRGIDVLEEVIKKLGDC